MAKTAYPVLRIENYWRMGMDFVLSCFNYPDDGAPTQFPSIGYFKHSLIRFCRMEGGNSRTLHDSATFELELRRFPLIDSSNDPSMERPAVRTEICVGGVPKTVAGNLFRHSRFKYKLPIGRNFLNDDIAGLSVRKFIAVSASTKDPAK